ncbi:MAG: hypothetical protein AAF430_14445 [Myxococcota bacterium]
MQRPGLLLLALATFLGTTPMAWASGGYGGGGGGGGSFGGYRSQSDPVYDRGKALFNGRTRPHRGLEVCLSRVAEGGEPETVPVTRRSLTPYRRGPVRDVALRLVDCEAPQERLGNRLSPDEFQSLLYYLNKRYALRLDD